MLIMDKVEWTCKCGQENSIKSRYCQHCSEEIPKEFIDKTAKEEILFIWRHFYEEAVTWWNKGVKSREDFCLKTYKPKIISVILAFIVINLVIWRIKVGVLQVVSIFENVLLIIFTFFDRVGVVLSALLNGIGGRLAGLMDGMVKLVCSQEDRVHIIGKSWKMLTERIGDIIKEIGVNNEKLNALERIKGCIHVFVK